MALRSPPAPPFTFANSTDQCVYVPLCASLPPRSDPQWASPSYSRRKSFSHILCVPSHTSRTPPLPSCTQNTYAELLTQLKQVEQQMTVQEAAVQAADRGQFNLLSGRLASTITSAAKAAFIPDMASQHIETAKTLLVRSG